jgi:hypothetical protein
MSRIAGTREEYLLPADHPMFRAARTAMICGVAALALSILGLATDREQFFRSWLVSYLFWLGPALGSMGILMLQHITGGRWGVALRRVLEAGARTLPLLALCFLPIALGMGHLFEWADPEVVAHDPLLQHKAFYLNREFFLARAVLYFILWIGVANHLSRWSRRQDEAPSPIVDRKLHFMSRAGLAVYALTMTFASVDWAMSLEPHWFSHIYGVIFIGGQILTAMMVAVAVMVRLAKIPSVGEFVDTDRFHDFGKLLLAFIMLWAYFALSQFLIIWSANLPEETPWYLTRRTGGWQVLAWALVLFHFVAPFVVLLSRHAKRTPAVLGTIVTSLLFMRYVDLYWWVVPSFHPEGFTFHWLDVTTMVAIGGLWFAAFVRLLRPHPVLPLNDRYYSLAEMEEEPA